VNKVIRLIPALLLLFCAGNLVFAENEDFFKAVEKNDLEKVKKYLDNGVKPDSAAKNGKTGLMIASEKGNLPVVRLLVEKGAGLDKRNDKNNTALHFAVFNIHNDIVEYLCKNKADVDAEGFEGQTPIVLAAEMKNEGAVEILITHKANLRSFDKKGNSAYIYALNNNDGALKILMKKELSRQITDGDYEMFAEAVINADVREIKKFVGIGIDVNMGIPLPAQDIDSPGYAIDAVMGQNNFELAELLIKAGANLNVSEPYGQNGVVSPLFYAVRGKNKKLTKLILESGAKTGMDLAIDMADDTETVNLLIHYGAGVNADIHGSTPLLGAVLKNNFDKVKLLLKNGADINGTFDSGGFCSESQGYTGDTPLMWAARDGNAKMAELLIQSGADINKQIAGKCENIYTTDSPDLTGYTALRYARENKHAEIVAMLIKAGAK
jgi:ankyrin repeat protein